MESYYASLNDDRQQGPSPPRERTQWTKPLLAAFATLVFAGVFSYGYVNYAQVHHVPSVIDAHQNAPLMRAQQQPAATTPAPTTTAPATTAPATTTPAPGATTAAPTPAPNLTKNGTFPGCLKELEKKSYMKPVHVIQARVQKDEPVWDANKNAFVSSVLNSPDFNINFRALLDTVNTASVEGALMYVQAECIDYSTRGDTDKCTRKNGVQWVVFYDLVIDQPDAALAEFENEYGPFIAMDGGRCTPNKATDGKETFPDICNRLNGDQNASAIGPYIGGEDRSTNEKAPYPNTTWYSFPNTCPLVGWRGKNETCRTATKKGLCDFDQKPNGIDCTYNYRVLGYVALDDLVGITKLTSNKTNQPFANFSQFCNESGVEFATKDGKYDRSIPFWNDPLNKTANQERTKKLIELYQGMVNKSTTVAAIKPETVALFKPLPDIATLVKENPKCYENVKKCATAANGCKRQLYGQVCVVCDKKEDGCEVAPKDFKFPDLKKEVSNKKKNAAPVISSHVYLVTMMVLVAQWILA